MERRIPKFHTIGWNEPVPEIGSRFWIKDCLIIVQKDQGGKQVELLYSDGNGKVVENYQPNPNSSKTLQMTTHGLVKIWDEYYNEVYSDKNTALSIYNVLRINDKTDIRIAPLNDKNFGVLVLMFSVPYNNTGFYLNIVKTLIMGEEFHLRDGTLDSMLRKGANLSVQTTALKDELLNKARKTKNFKLQSNVELHPSTEMMLSEYAPEAQQAFNHQTQIYFSDNININVFDGSLVYFLVTPVLEASEYNHYKLKVNGILKKEEGFSSGTQIQHQFLPDEILDENLIELEFSTVTQQ